MPLAWSVFARG